MSSKTNDELRQYLRKLKVDVAERFSHLTTDKPTSTIEELRADGTLNWLTESCPISISIIFLQFGMWYNRLNILNFIFSRARAYESIFIKDASS